MQNERLSVLNAGHPRETGWMPSRQGSGDAILVSAGDGRSLTTSPDRVLIFSARSDTKLDLVNYYLAVAEGAAPVVFAADPPS